MKLRATVSFCFLFAVAFAQQSDSEDDTCKEIRKGLERGNCPAAGGSPCRNVCSGVYIKGQENCTLSECCFTNGRCVLRNRVVSNSEKIVVMRSISEATNNFRIAATKVVEENDTDTDTDTKARGLSLGGGFGGGFGGAPCLRFPYNCQTSYGPQFQTIESPINIPYCQRIACNPSDPTLENDFQRCVSQPGCYFDAELFQYRSLVGQAILPGVPVCHDAIRNRAFKRRALETATTTGSWNPLFTSCLLNEYRTEIFGDAVGCQLLDILEYFGHTPKRAGWNGILPRECSLIGACWKTSTTHAAFCAYPVNSQGQPTLRSSNDRQTTSQHGSDLYGLPECYPFSRSLTGASFLNAYHTCLSSGCATSVDSSVVWQNLISFGSNLTYPLNVLYISMVYSGQIRPDNYVEMLHDINKRPYSGFGGSGWPGSIPTIPFNRPGVPQVLPFSLPVNRPARNFNLNGNPQVQPPFGFPPGNPQVRPPFGFPPGNPQVRPPFGFPPGNPQVQPPFGFPPRPPVFPPINLNPCPFSTDYLSYPNLPRLKGSLRGCCDKPMCYTPKQDLYSSYSGLSPYFNYWSTWGECNVNCGGGRQNRTRTCVVTSRCGQQAIRSMQCDPRISRYEERRCNTHICPTYENWIQWSPCSLTCGGGTRTRSRECNGQGQCTGPASMNERCQTGRCPTYQYGPWGGCGVTCGEGFRSRTKTCTDRGDYTCSSSSQERQPCKSYCGKWVRSCNTNTCCTEYKCRQSNGRRGYCRDRNTRLYPTYSCYEGSCASRWPRPNCGNTNQVGAYSLNVGN